MGRQQDELKKVLKQMNKRARDKSGKRDHYWGGIGHNKVMNNNFLKELMSGELYEHICDLDEDHLRKAKHMLGGEKPGLDYIDEEGNHVMGSRTKAVKLLEKFQMKAKKKQLLDIHAPIDTENNIVSISTSKADANCYLIAVPADHWYNYYSDIADNNLFGDGTAENPGLMAKIAVNYMNHKLCFTHFTSVQGINNVTVNFGIDAMTVGLFSTFGVFLDEVNHEYLPHKDRFKLAVLYTGNGKTYAADLRNLKIKVQQDGYATLNQPNVPVSGVLAEGMYRVDFDQKGGNYSGVRLNCMVLPDVLPEDYDGPSGAEGGDLLVKDNGTEGNADATGTNPGPSHYDYVYKHDGYQYWDGAYYFRFEEDGTMSEGSTGFFGRSTTGTYEATTALINDIEVWNEHPVEDPTMLELYEPVDGIIQVLNQEDFFKFEAEAGTSYDFMTMGPEVSGDNDLIDSVLTLYGANEDGTMNLAEPIMDHDDNEYPDDLYSSLTYAVPAAAEGAESTTTTLFLKVNGLNTVEGTDGTGNYRITVHITGQAPPEPEPNLHPKENPVMISAGETADGRIGVEGEEDWWKCEVGADDTSETLGISFETLATGLEGDIGDTKMWIYSANEDGTPNDAGDEVAYNDDGGEGYYSKITLSNLEAGTYFIKVTGYSVSYTGNYQLQMVGGIDLTPAPE